MSLPRRIRHRVSRRLLVAEAFVSYLAAFGLIFLDLHFLGIKHYYPSLHREYVAVNSAAHQAIFYAFLGPAIWVLQEYVLPSKESWTWFRNSDWQIRQLVMGGMALMVAATFVAWRWMLPLWALAGSVALYLRLSRPKDSL